MKTGKLVSTKPKLSTESARALSRLRFRFRVALAGPVCLSVTSLHVHDQTIVHDENTPKKGKLSLVDWFLFIDVQAANNRKCTGWASATRRKKP